MFSRLCIPQSLSKLTHQQIPQHLASSDNRRNPHSRKVERARKCIAKAKKHHGRDPAARILEGKAVLRDLVTLDLAALEVMHAARRVDLGCEFARLVRPFLPSQDVEVIVGRVSSRVALGSDGGAVYD